MPIDPFTIGAVLLALLGTTAVVAVVLLSAAMVREYIRSKRMSSLTTQVAAVMGQQLADGKYRVAVGFLDGMTKIIDPKVWEASNLDGELKELLQRDNEPVLIQV